MERAYRTPLRIKVPFSTSSIVFEFDHDLEQGDDAQDQHHHAAEGHDAPDEVDGQAASYEEDPGDTVDTPRIDAHVSLARMHHMFYCTASYTNAEAVHSRM